MKNLTHAVSEHALERLRERCPEHAKARAADLRHLIDVVLCQSLHSERLEAINDRGSLAEIVELAPVFPDLYAVLKSSRFRSSDHPQEKAVTTILTGEMYQYRLLSGIWTKNGRAARRLGTIAF